MVHAFHLAKMDGDVHVEQALRTNIVELLLTLAWAAHGCVISKAFAFTIRLLDRNLAPAIVISISLSFLSLISISLNL
jgi:hypothetical protein